MLVDSKIFFTKFMISEWYYVTFHYDKLPNANHPKGGGDTDAGICLSMPSL